MKFFGLLQRILPPIWLGMIAAIAVEARLKFQAPNITRELGLEIGKIVFNALNRAEIIIALLLVIAFFAAVSTRKAKIIFGIILSILITQTFWLMPALIERIDLITGGQNVPDSPIHFFYIAFEICKISLLLILSVMLNWQTADSSNL